MPLIFQEQGYKVESEGSSIYVVTPEGKKEPVGTPSAGREKIKEMLKESGQYGKRGYFGNSLEYQEYEEGKAEGRKASPGGKMQDGKSKAWKMGWEDGMYPSSARSKNPFSNKAIAISVQEMAKLVQNIPVGTYTSEGQSIGSKDIKPGMTVHRGNVSYQVTNSDPAKFRGRKEAWIQEVGPKTFRLIVDGSTEATLTSEAACKQYARDHNIQITNSSLQNEHYKGFYITDVGGNHIVYKNGELQHGLGGPDIDKVKQRIDLKVSNSSFQNGVSKATQYINEKVGNARKEYTDINTWKSACQKEFDKRGLSGSIRWSPPNSAGDTFAYIGHTSEYVGKWFGSNNYGEVLEK